MFLKFAGFAPNSTKVADCNPRRFSLPAPNKELQNCNNELASADNDLVNLLGTVDSPFMMLIYDLRVRRLTPGTQKPVNLIPISEAKEAHISITLKGGASL